jgi:hypothetical protein
MIESRPLPQLAKSAIGLLRERMALQFAGEADALARETVAALGLREEDNWIVDFEKGEIRREVPDPVPVPVPPRPRRRRRTRRK